MMRVVQIEPAPIPTFTASTPSSIKRLGGFRGRHVAGNHVHIRELAADAAHGIEHALRMAMRRVDDERVDVGGDQRLGSFHRVACDPDRGRHTQPSQRVLAGVRVFHRLLDVFHRDQALQHERLIDDQQLLDLVLVQDFPRRFERRADRHRDEVLFRHHLGNRALYVGLEAEVPIGEDAHQPTLFRTVLRDRHAGDPVLLHQLQRLEDAFARRERHRIHDHPAL